MSAIDVRGVGRTFPARDGGEPFVALDGVDLAVRSGEFLALVGPSGCGKSTLLDLIGGVDGVEKTTTSIILSCKIDRGQPLAPA